MPIGSGELARLSGVSSDTLRHYERVGVLPRPSRSPNNYRVYPDQAVERVRLVRRALAFGFSLTELSAILKERDKGGRPCRKVRAIAAEKLDQTELRLKELTRLRDDLRLVLEDWDARLDATSPGQQAHLLDALSSLSAPSAPSAPPLSKGNPHEAHQPSSIRSSRLSGHWSHESAEKRTPAARRQKR